MGNKYKNSHKNGKTALKIYEPHTFMMPQQALTRLTLKQYPLGAMVYRNAYANKILKYFAHLWRWCHLVSRLKKYHPCPMEQLFQISHF